MLYRNLNHFAIGLFVFAMLVAGLVLTLVLAGRSGSTTAYSVALDNVADLKFGTQVRFEGLPIGQVTEIAANPAAGEPRFLLSLDIGSEWGLPVDSVARIGASSFLAAKTLDIEAGRSPKTLDAGARIASAPPLDVFSVVSEAAAEFGGLSRESLRPLLVQLGELVSATSRVMERDVPLIMSRVDGLAETLEGEAPLIVADLARFADRLDGSAARLEAMLSAETADQVGRILGNAEDFSLGLVGLADDLATTTQRIEGLVSRSEALLAEAGPELEEGMKDARYVLRSLSQNVDAITHNLGGAARNMNEFTRMIRQNPRLLIGGGGRREASVGSRRSGQ